MNNEIELSALDTLFFKDGKPFSMGEESWAKGLFPPFPSVFYGALRSTWLAGNMHELKRAGQADDPTAKLKIEGCLLALNGQAAFPIPLDLYALKDQEENKAQAFQLQKVEEGFISDYELSHYLKTRKNEKIEELGGKALLKEADFRNYLNGSTSKLNYEELGDYTTAEPKVGIGRNPQTRTAEPGQLYRLEMKRLEGPKGDRFSFKLKTAGLDLPANTKLRFGAEGRIAEYESIPFPEIRKPDLDGKCCFKLYFASAVIFEKGAVPVAWLQAHGLKLLACANGRTQHIGGFDMVKRKPKPMYKANPAGTVFYLELTRDNATEIFQKLHEGSIYKLAPEGCQLAAHYEKQGFGLTYIAKINN